MNRAEVCLTPSLFETVSVKNPCTAVVIDVLRATTAFCAALASGVKSIIPLASLADAERYQAEGCMLAAERDGEKIDFADFGNSPVQFLKSNLRGLELAYTTTNGTQAIEISKNCNHLATACFSNLSAVARWLKVQKSDVIIVCAGWKNAFSLEDTMCAGALLKILVDSGGFYFSDDASLAAITIWNKASENHSGVAQQASHYIRLEQLGLIDDLEYCFRVDTTNIVPVWDGSRLLRVDC